MTKTQPPDNASIDPPSLSECPQCGGDLLLGYGLYGGGIGGYALCESEDCGFFVKRQDPEHANAEGKQP